MGGLRVWELTTTRAYRALLEELLRVHEVYVAWIFELDGFFGKLNDQVCGERYRATTSTLPGCGVAEAHTPYVGEASLLAFRDFVLMHHVIREPLLHAVEGEEGVRLSRWFGGDEGAVEPPQSPGAPTAEDMQEMLAEGEEGRAVPRVGMKRKRRRSLRVVENLADVLERLAKVLEEMDVADDPLRKGQGRDAFRKLLLRPVREAVAELRLDGKVAVEEGSAAGGRAVGLGWGRPVKRARRGMCWGRGDEGGASRGVLSL
jgi:hypothetical protein